MTGVAEECKEEWRAEEDNADQLLNNPLIAWLWSYTSGPKKKEMIMDIHTVHNVLIIVHAVAAIISFFAGCLLIFSPAFTANRRLFNLYWWALIGMVILLMSAILVYWTEYSNIERIIFPGLLVLAFYMLYRARGANYLLGIQHNDWKHNYIEHIGFTLISLFEGFIIVSGLNSGIPGWLVALLAILGFLVGRWLIGFAQSRVG
jgi:hypothetical protein